jgi:hypothetical protein
MRSILRDRKEKQHAGSLFGAIVLAVLKPRLRFVITEALLLTCVPVQVPAGRYVARYQCTGISGQ